MHRRTSHAVQGPGPTQQQDQQWSSITLDSASDDFVLPNVAINAHTLGPYDPRTQDPSIAPWALHEEEELHVNLLDPKLFRSSSLYYSRHTRLLLYRPQRPDQQIERFLLKHPASLLAPLAYSVARILPIGLVKP